MRQPDQRSQHLELLRHHAEVYDHASHQTAELQLHSILHFLLPREPFHGQSSVTILWNQNSIDELLAKCPRK